MTMNLTETAAELLPSKEQPMCVNHPHEPAEWDELCQECWEELCASGLWGMLREAGL